MSLIRTECNLPVLAAYDGPAAVQVCMLLRSYYFDAYLVGGCVRDLLMGRIPHDFDVCTSATPDQVKLVFGDKAVPTGEKYGTVTVNVTSIDSAVHHIEVTTFRGDGDYSDGRHPDSVKFSTNLEEDLARRDFTINAMAYDAINETLVMLDEQSHDDLKLNVIRCVGDPNQRFKEDALRMLRAIRFSATFGFQIDGDTADAILLNAPNIEKVSKERIRDELTKTLMSDHPEALLLAQRLGLTKYFLPEFDEVVNTPQNNVWHRLDLADHTFEVVRGVNKNDRILRWAAFLHDFGKPLCRTTDSEGHDHYYGHASISALIARRVCDRFKFDNTSKDAIGHLCYAHDLLCDIDANRTDASKPCYRRAIRKVGMDLFPRWAELRGADIMAHSLKNVVGQLKVLSYAKAVFLDVKRQKAPLTVRELAINGNDVCETLGVDPGPIVGQMLQIALEAVLDDPLLNERDKLLALIKERRKDE